MPQAPTRIIYYEINLLESDENTSSCEQMCNNVEQVYIEAAEEVLGERNRRKDPG